MKERDLHKHLIEMSKVVNSSTETAQIIQALLMESAKAINSQAAGIALLEENQWVMRHGYNLPQDLIGRSFSDEEKTCTALAMRTEKTDDRICTLDHTARPGMVGVLERLSVQMHPLTSRDRTIGCLFFKQPPHNARFDDIEEGFAENAGVLVSLALQNERRGKEREQLTEELETAGGRFQAVLEEMPAGVIIAESPSGALILGNQQVGHILRYPLDKLSPFGQYHAAFHLSGSPYLPEEWPLARSIRKGEMVSGEEISIRRGDGAEGVISVSSKPINDHSGETIAAIMIFYDITERKEAERTRADLAAIVESADAAIISFDKKLNGIIKTWNRGAERIYQYTAEEAVGKHISLIVPPGNQNDIIYMLDALKRGQHIEHHETTRMKKNGELIQVSLSASPIRHQEGTIMGASTIAYDITERKLTEQAQQESEIKFRKIASAAQDAVILINHEGLVEFWNDAATKIFGFNSEEIVGRNLHSFIMPERYAADFEKGFKAFQTSGKGKFIGKTYEITAKRKDGTEFPVELSQAAFKLKDKWSSIGIVRDITERKRAEAELKQTLGDLERSNRELQQFASVASHDLQEPLRTVSSFVELLGRKYQGRLDETADKYISLAVEGTHRMATLISDLLAYSRVGTQGSQFGPVAMSGVLKQGVENLKTAIQENEAVITRDDLPVVTGDQTQLVQLLQNLIGNAIKFRKKDVQPQIRISSGHAGNEWQFGVHDNGIGIEPGYYEKIFAIFERLHTLEEYPGTGIGLAICKRIVERHGGRIWVESKPGEGSSFFFSIPNDSAEGKNR